MKDRFNLKQECIFVSLASYAHDIITQGDIYAFNGEAMCIANAINTHFKKKTKRYSRSRMDKLSTYIADIMGPAFPDKMNAAIIMASSLHYLLNEGHYESKQVFTPFKLKINNIINTLEKSSEFRPELNKANETLIKMLDSTPSNYKANIDKEKIIENQYKLVSILKELMTSITLTNKLEKPFNKINIILDTYLDNKELPLPYVISDLEDVDMLYYIVAITEKLKKVTCFKIEIIDKLKSINLNYLVPNKEALNNSIENLDNILL